MTTSAELRILQPGWIFKSPTFLAWRRKSIEHGRPTQAARHVLGGNLIPRLRD
jgi:hypothetical protein